jgi:hypothetical protein
MNNFAIALALWANPSKKDGFAWNETPSFRGILSATRFRMR